MQKLQHNVFRKDIFVIYLVYDLVYDKLPTDAIGYWISDGPSQLGESTPSLQLEAWFQLEVET